MGSEMCIRDRTKEGTFEGEIEITFSNGGIHTVYDLVKLKVRSDFD